MVFISSLLGSCRHQDALEKVWDLLQPGGVVVIDDFFHKVQGPARAAAQFFRSRQMWRSEVVGLEVA